MHIELSAFPIKNASGEVDVLRRYQTRRTDRKRTEEELRRREAELTDFFENATIGLHWVGPDGIILRVNQAELDLLGYSREEYVGHHIASFMSISTVINDVLRRLQAGEVIQRLRSPNALQGWHHQTCAHQFKCLPEQRKVCPHALLYA